MSTLNHKIDFALVLSVRHANPNGDPLNGNRPRETYEGYGEISDVCLKRKIRNRMMDLGAPVFVQSNDRCIDGCKSLKDRADSIPALKKEKDADVYAKVACQTWLDVRSFGQVFAFKNGGEADGVSIGVRGPVSIHPAFSVDPVEISSLQITKSVNGVSGAKKIQRYHGHEAPCGLRRLYYLWQHQLPACRKDRLHAGRCRPDQAGSPHII